MLRSTILWLLPVAALTSVLVPATTIAAPTGYLVADLGGGNGGDDLLTLVDIADFDPSSNETNVGTGTGTTSIKAIDLEPTTGILFGVDGGQFGTLDRGSGVFIPIGSGLGTDADGSLGPVELTDVRGLSFHPNTGVLYAVHRPASATDNDLLFQIDTAAGTYVPDAYGTDIDYVPIEIVASNRDVADIAFDPTNLTFYGVMNDGPPWSGPVRLSVIDPLTGGVGLVGDVEDGGGTDLYVEGLTFDATGQLWGVRTDLPELYEIDKATGLGTNPRPLDNGSEYGAVTFPAPAATLALVSSFGAYPNRGGVVVEWETSSEVGTAGFYLYRRDGRRGEPVLVDEQLLPAAVGAPQGAIYRLLDRGASPRQAHEYTLVEVEAGGVQRSYGPFRVEVDWRRQRPEMSGRSQVEPRAASPRTASRREKARDRAAARASTSSAGISAAGDRRLGPRPAPWRTETWLELTTREAGLYRISDDEMAAAFGVPLVVIQSRIARGGLLLENRGRAIPWQAERDSSAIHFYGEAIDSLYSLDNVFWLRLRNGLSTEWGPVGLASASVSAGIAFQEHSHFEQDRIPALVVARNPESDYWFWEGIAAGDPTQGSKSFSLAVPGLEPDSRWAELGVEVLGLTDTPSSPDHHLVVRLNGGEIGSTSWDGAVPHEATFAFSASLLHEVENTVEVEGLLDGDAPHSLFFIDSFDLSYRRLYRAENDRLVFSPDRSGTVTIDGFGSPGVRAYDVTDPKRAAQVRLSPTPDGRSVSLRVVAGRTYLAVGETAVGRPTIRPVEVDPRLDLRDRGNAADYLLIAPGWLTAGAEALADHRRQDGLEARVVGLEEVYRQFNHGLASPHALYSFLKHAYHEWRRPPLYVVLVGAGSVDYKDHLGLGGNLVPPIMVGTPWGIFASDVELGDVVEDGGPEIAVGRIPVVSYAELDAYLDKLVTYESGAAQGRALLLADDPDAGGDFVADSDAIGELLRQWEIEEIYLSREPIEIAREHLFTTLRRGVALVNYVGHGGMTQLAHEGLLTQSDVSELDNRDSPPVVAALTCVVGRFEIPGLDSLAESLVLEPEGGAVAVWAPSGLSLNGDAAILNQAFVGALGDGETDDIVLGDAVLTALRRHAVEGRYPFLWRIYNLLGDPALPLR